MGSLHRRSTQRHPSRQGPKEVVFPYEVSDDEDLDNSESIAPLDSFGEEASGNNDPNS